MDRLTGRVFTGGMSTNTQDTTLTLVLGGTGKTGRRVAERLTARGWPIRIGSRSHREAPFDWDDPGTWKRVLQDVDSVYLTYYPDLAFPGAAGKIRSFVDLAVDNGIRRLVLLSGREEATQVSEQTVRDSGLEWTILRASWFSQDFSEHFLLEPVLSGVVALPGGNVAEPFVDVEDIADVAVAALTEDRHIGELYELTGPRLLTFTEAVEESAQVTGREVRYVPVTPEQYAAALTEKGVPADYAAALTDLFTNVLDGRNAHLTDGVQRALGREPRDFSDYVRDAAASGVWAAR
jgi:uncharacterized protein YbjT (DUF2867 family)